MFGVTQPEPGHVNWSLPKGDTFALRCQQTASGWDGRTWTATFRSRGAGSDTDMSQEDDTTADALNFACWFETADLDPGVYLYRAASVDPGGVPAGRTATLVYGEIQIEDVD